MFAMKSNWTFRIKSYNFEIISVIRFFSIQEDSKWFEDVVNSETRGARFRAIIRNLFPSRKKAIVAFRAQEGVGD